MERTTTLRAFFEGWYLPMRLAGRSPRTARQYRNAIEQLSRYLGHEVCLGELRDDLLEGFLASVVTQGSGFRVQGSGAGGWGKRRSVATRHSPLTTRSAATANKFRAHLLAVWRYAARKAKNQRIVKIPGEVDRVPQPKHMPSAWTTDDLSKILQEAAKRSGSIGGIPAAAWWSALILLLYDTGLRLTAAMSLRWRDVDWDRGLVLVPAETQKQRADQAPGLSQETLAALASMRGAGAVGSGQKAEGSGQKAEGSGQKAEGEKLPSALCPPRTAICPLPTAPLFPWPWDKRREGWPTLTRHYKQILRAAGLPCGRKDLFHRIRRTTASYLERAGGDPTEQLGHSSPQVTRGYLDPRITQQRRQVELLPRPGRGAIGG